MPHPDALAALKQATEYFSFEGGVSTDRRGYRTNS